MENVVALSGYKSAFIEATAARAAKLYGPEVLKDEGEIPSSMIGEITVSPRRVGRHRIVYLCYSNGKLIGSARKDYES